MKLFMTVARFVLKLAQVLMLVIGVTAGTILLLKDQLALGMGFFAMAGIVVAYMETSDLQEQVDELRQKLEDRAEDAV